MDKTPDDPAAHLLELHGGIDDVADALAQYHGARLRCARGCSSCCVDGITVFEVEADRIRANHADLLDRGTPHAEGMCAFLDADGACRVYDDRPYVCRTQGLPLRWFDEADNGEVVERRDICPLNDEGQPIEELDAEACWTIGPVESSLAVLQERSGEGELRRIALRDLFR